MTEQKNEPKSTLEIPRISEKKARKLFKRTLREAYRKMGKAHDSIRFTCGEPVELKGAVFFVSDIKNGRIILRPPMAVPTKHEVKMIGQTFNHRHAVKRNFIIRFIVVLILGVVFFALFYLLAPLLGYSGGLLVVNPTPFIILMLYVQLLFAYCWRRWPLNTAM